MSLLEMLHKKHPDALDNTDGFEAAFSTLHDNSSSEEITLHKQIRDWTIHGLRPINEAMLSWLEYDTLFKTTHIKARDEKKRLLAESLILLHANLLLWRCKYDAWIPAHPKHPLLYMADKARHGIGYPSGLDKLIQDVMTTLKKSAPTLLVVIEKPLGDNEPCSNLPSHI